MKPIAADLRERIARARNGAYRRALERELRELEAESATKDEMAAALVTGTLRPVEAEELAAVEAALEADAAPPEPDQEAASDPVVQAPEVVKTRTRRAAESAPPDADVELGAAGDDADFDLRATLDKVMSFWRGHGFNVLRRKAKRGDLAALRELGALTRMLIALDDDRARPCTRPCCLVVPRIEAFEDGTPEAEAAIAEAATDPSITVIRASWPVEGEKG